MTGSIYPDELVSILFDEIAYNKGKIQLAQLWEISKDIVNISDITIKKFVFSSLVANEDITLFKNDSLIDESVSFDDIINEEASISVGINEDKLWVTLTGYNKKESLIGNAAFELLLEIARCKEKGINTMDLTKNTQQDSRSITGRLKKLNHLVDDIQLVYKGHLVKHLTLKKFKNKDMEEKPYINMRDQLGKIVTVVKNSKNGIRQTTDLKRELKLDREKRLSKAFISAISWLDEKGYLQKVMVVSPTNPAIKIRCVKYLRDYSNENKNISYPEENDSSDDGEGEGDDTRAAEDEDEFEGLDNFNATNLLQDQGLVMEDQGNLQRNEVLLNRFYPIQNQTYDLTANTGETGLSTMKAITSITGKDYQRAFTKSSEYYIQTVGKKQFEYTGLNLVRIYDFEGKKKFFRLFTEENFRKMTDSPAQNNFESLPLLKTQKFDLASLNKKYFVALNNTLRFGTDGNENEVFFWHGSNMVPLKTKEVKQQTKGRKKRTTVNEEHDIEVPKLKKIKQQPSDTFSEIKEPTQSSDLVELTQPKQGNLSVDRTVSIAGFSASSLKSLQRQRALLEVVKKMGGVAFLKESLFDELSKALGSSTLVDKKTARGDVSLMVKSGKLLVRLAPKSKKRLIFLPELGEEDLEKYLNNEKNKKKAIFADVLHNTDIYFFDQSAKTRFNSSTKSAERIRNFQKKNKSSLGKGSLSGTEKKHKKKITGDKLAPSEKRSKKRKNSLFSTINDQEKPIENNVNEGLTEIPKATFHVGRKSGIEALIMAVVITKSIANEIQWDKISYLFPKNSIENLKKQWTVRRVRMGQNGWKAYVDKWKRILILAIKNEAVSLPDVENIDLQVLIKLWINFEKEKNDKPTSLYKDYDLNTNKYTLVKESPLYGSQYGLVMSSMIQRETSSLKHTFTFAIKEIKKSENDRLLSEGNIKSVIRSILLDKVQTGKDEIEILKDVPKDELDKIVMDMAKTKQVYLHGVKLEATSSIMELLETKGIFDSFSKSNEYDDKASNLLEAQNGIIVNQEISDIASWLLIDLISRKKMRLDVIPLHRDIQHFNYTTRKFEIETLTPPLICTIDRKSKPLFSPSVTVPVPLGKPYSRLWINSEGLLREGIWKHLISLVINEILFSPGIVVERLERSCNYFVSRQELSEICQWLTKKGLLSELPFSGYSVTYKWYKILA